MLQQFSPLIFLFALILIIVSNVGVIKSGNGYIVLISNPIGVEYSDPTLKEILNIPISLNLTNLNESSNIIVPGSNNTNQSSNLNESSNIIVPGSNNTNQSNNLNTTMPQVPPEAVNGTNVGKI